MKNEFRERAERTVRVLKDQLGMIRTGRANPALVEHITVEYYGTRTPLLQMATITTPEPRLIVIQPWDTSQLKNIETTLQQSDLQLPAVNDGTVIRIAIPPLTEERRQEYVKLVGKRLEEAKIALRSIREDVLKVLKKAALEKEISEDVQHVREKETQELVEEFQKHMGELADEKIGEITSIT